jgi:hypothetical protein
MKNWQPDIDLDRLLAALSEEIIGTSDEDVRTLCGQVGTPISGGAREMRARVAAINDGETEPTLALADISFRRELSVRSH